LSLHFQVFDQRKAQTKAERIGFVIVVDVRRQSSQPAGTFGAHRGGGDDERPAYLQGPIETGRGGKDGTMGSGTFRV